MAVLLGLVLLLMELFESELVLSVLLFQLGVFRLICSSSSHNAIMSVSFWASVIRAMLGRSVIALSSYTTDQNVKRGS